MELTAKHRATGLEATTTLNIPEDFDSLVSLYGGDIVATYAIRAIRIAAQNDMRLELAKETTKIDDVDVPVPVETRIASAVSAGTNWRPPEPRVADPVRKALKALKGLSKDQLDAIYAHIDASDANSEDEAA